MKLEALEKKYKEPFHDALKNKIDRYVHMVYKITLNFPKEELYGATSQLRRSALSVALNYIEGYARRREKVNKNFLEIAYGSLKESRYLIEFAEEEKYLTNEQCKVIVGLADEIGAMLWGILRKL